MKTAIDSLFVIVNKAGRSFTSMSMINSLAIFAILSLITQSSIRQSHGGEGSAYHPGTMIADASRGQGEISILSFDVQTLPAEIRYQGKIVMGARWIDNYGENFLLLTQRDKFPSKEKCDNCFNPTHYAYKYVRNGDQLSSSWRYRIEADCSFDQYTGFLNDALFITDLDSNGVAESTFLFLNSCQSDLFPPQLKLIMREGATKYTIHGTTRPLGKHGGGEMKIDAAFNEANPVLKTFAIEKWKQYVTRSASIR
jgi:hypothetical protein